MAHCEKMAEQTPVRVAVWGIGYHARKNVLPNITACGGVTLAGVYSRNQANARVAVADSSAIVWSSPDEMLASPDVDAVYLCTPIALHYEQGLAVIRAGKHLLCEKALTARAAHSLELIAEARTRNLALCEAFMYAFHPQFRRLTELVSAPEFGGIETLSCWFGMPKLEQPGFRHSRELGGGGFLDLACYPISLAGLLINGNPRVASAAVGIGDKEAVDMTGYAVLEFPGGAIAHLEWGFGRAYRNEVSVWGEDRSLYADRIFSKSPEYESRIQIRDRRGAEDWIEIAPANAFVEMLEEFSRATHDSRARQDLGAVATRQAQVVQLMEAALREMF